MHLIQGSDSAVERHQGMDILRGDGSVHPMLSILQAHQSKTRCAVLEAAVLEEQEKATQLETQRGHSRAEVAALQKRTDASEGLQKDFS